MEKTLKKLYPNDHETALDYINELIGMHKTGLDVAPFNERDVILETYGDTIEFDKKGLKSLKYFCDVYFKDIISIIHLLPLHPFTSDCGYAVSDYMKVRNGLGCWVHVRDLKDHFRLMFDGVFNHTSASHKWFEGFISGDEVYKNYYISDGKVTYKRPRNSELFHDYSGKKVMTTFSKNQVDLNYRNIYVLMEVLHIIGVYIANGASYLRLDAVRYMWKDCGGEEGHLFLLLDVIKQYVEALKPGFQLICQVNDKKVNAKPFKPYGLTYRYELAPLILSGIYEKKAAKVNAFLNGLDDDSQVINMLSTHDGISMRAVKELLTEEEIETMRDRIRSMSGFETVVADELYEFNINFLDALSTDKGEMDIKKFLMAHFVLLSIQGIPSIYIHSILGSRGSYPKYIQTGDQRGINRGKLKLDVLEYQLTHEFEKMSIFDELERLLHIRKEQAAFHPETSQNVIHIDSRVFLVERGNILCIANFSDEAVKYNWTVTGVDLLSGSKIDDSITLNPYEYMWIKKERD